MTEQQGVGQPIGSPESKAEEPAFLEQGQNIFDQPLFADILTELSRYTGDTEVSLQNWRMLLGRVSRNRQRKQGENPDDLHKKPVTAYEIGKAGEDHPPLRGPARQACRNAWTAIGDQINQYPRWTEYLGSVLERGYYNPDGSLILHNVPTEGLSPVPSYGAWLAERGETAAALKEASIRVVLERTFPQDLNGQTTGDAIVAVQGGKPSFQRNRTIREASK